MAGPYYVNTKIDGAGYIAEADLEAIETGFVNVDADKANISGTLAQFAATTSLQLKTLISDETGSGSLVFATSPTLSGPVLTTPQINDTSSDHQYVFAGSELAADRTVTLPLLASGDTFVFEAHIQTLTNKTLTSPVLTTPQINDTSLDHQYIFAGSELAADRTVTLPLLASGDTFVFEAHIQTLTNKTLTSPVLTTPQINDTSSDHQYIFASSELAADRTVTLPLLASGDTFVFEAHIQTLSNKTLASPSITGKMNLAVYAVSGTTPALSASNGIIQTWTLTGNSVPTDSLSAGDFIRLMIDDGTAYTITWPTITWQTDSGVAPTLKTSGYTGVNLYKIGSTLYGERAGDGG